MSYDPNVIANNANSFLLAAERCFEEKQLLDGRIQFLAVPGIVCRAFSIELYLKTVLTIENKKATGHELNKLYGKLSSGSQSILQNKLSLTESALRKKLDEVSNVFVEWRYLYESKSILSVDDFLKRLSAAVKSLAEESLAEAKGKNG